MRFNGAPAGHWLAAIVLLGAVLRFFPIWFGLPYLHARPDEEVAVFHALKMLEGDPNPHFFHWPSLTFYVFAALFAPVSWAHRALATEGELSAASYFLLARAFVALAGTVTIVLLFRMTSHFAGRTAALLASLFLSVALLHVRDSHFAMTDVLMTLLATLSLAILLRASVAGVAAPSSIPLRLFAIAGLTGGLAASTKYSAAAIVGAMAAAQMVLLWRVGGRVHPASLLPSVVFVAAFGVGFLVGTPYAVLDFDTFDGDLRFTMSHLSGGHGIDLGRGWWYHLRRSLPYGLGLPTCVAAMAGVAPLLRHYRPHAVVIAGFAVSFYASIGSGQTVFFRYVLPLVPLACLSAAIAVIHLASWLESYRGFPRRKVIAILAFLIAVPSLVNSVWFDVLLSKTDTRVLAARWLTPRLTSEMSLHDATGPYSHLDLAHVRFHPWSFDPATQSFGHPEGRTPDWLVLDESPLRLYSGAPFELRELARQKYSLVHTLTATRGRARSAVYDQQDAFFMPFSRFYTVERPGPTILIYRRIAP
ncbi:MAG: phospholipid carrier-dependent glycosyltransferase [Vicinamibacterales bacterium]